jgi:hypothetical protein
MKLNYSDPVIGIRLTSPGNLPGGWVAPNPKGLKDFSPPFLKRFDQESLTVLSLSQGLFLFYTTESRSKQLINLASGGNK